MKILHGLGVLAAVLGLMAAGCGGGGGSGSEGPSGGPSGYGTMTVHLVDAPTVAYTQINLHVMSVEIGNDDGWVVLGQPDQVFDLLTLTGGLSETLANGASLPAGHFTQMRLILGPDNTVTLADASTHPLKVPSGMQTGVKMPIEITVAQGDVADVWIDFDAAHSIQLHKTGNSGKYMLRPVVRAFSKVETGSISGVFTDVANGSPIAGATVFAETVDEMGTPRIVRGTFTGDAGAYTLDLLPLGHAYHVVSMPLVGGGSPAAYTAQASGAFSLSTGMPAATFDAAFTLAAAVGGISGTLTATAGADQSDVVNLRQGIGPGGEALIVAVAMAEVDGAETYGFPTVPGGDYTVQALRSTDNGDGTSSVAVSGVVGPQSVTNGTTTVMDISGL